MTSKLEGVDKEIYGYVCNSTSFLLLAGAGSGKTRTLVNVLQKIKETKRSEFLQKGQKVAVITYTNAACEEIRRRLGYDSAFSISTIHSFAWGLIQSFADDIREWKSINLNESIKKLLEKENRARNEESKANYEAKRLKKEEELKKLPSVRKFIYSPTELLSGLGALTHSDVIKICTDFLNQHNLMRQILASQFPILFIDECQDTQRHLLQAIIKTQQFESNNFSVGLFGDLMQRIYSDGYVGLRDNLPEDWKTPRKEENWRSPSRVVRLINKIRENEDDFQQISKQKKTGIVRLFIANSNTQKTDVEKFVKSKMAEICKDSLWKSDEGKVETLALEHKMIARRIGFSKFYEPISQNDSLKDGLLNGTENNALFLKKIFIPFVGSIKDKDDFKLIRILEKSNAKIQHSENQEFLNALKEIKKIIDDFSLHLASNHTIKDLLKIIHDNHILSLPEDLVKACKIYIDDEVEEKTYLWGKALEATPNELIRYFQYTDGELGFSTHQGVKGLEYPRVMAILDDHDAGGFLFRYEKLLGVEAPSVTDIKNENEGKDTAIRRTQRLFYVICSRAEESLAIVVYSERPNAVKEYTIDNGWFNDEEIEIYP